MCYNMLPTKKQNNVIIIKKFSLLMQKFQYGLRNGSTSLHSFIYQWYLWLCPILPLFKIPITFRSFYIVGFSFPKYKRWKNRATRKVVLFCFQVIKALFRRSFLLCFGLRRLRTTPVYDPSKIDRKVFPQVFNTYFAYMTF